jgi:voltage-gated potassium channel
LVVLGSVLAIGVCGYRIAGRDWLDALYMVVITVSSIGYTEHSQLAPGEKWFTIALIIFGLSAVVYVVGGLTQIVAAGEIRKALGLMRMTKEIDRLAEHVVVCGFGRIGQNLCDELHRQHRAFVVVDNDPLRTADATELGYLVVTGNATEEVVLKSAGIERASSLVTALPDDADNVFISLTARGLHGGLQIIARGENPSTLKKLVQAGADRVVLPAAIGAQRIAAILLKPSTVELTELVIGSSVMEVEFDEFTLPAASPLVGRTVRDAETRRKHGLLVVAIKTEAGQMVFNPDADAVFGAGDVVIVMGRKDDVQRFRLEHRI